MSYKFCDSCLIVPTIAVQNLTAFNYSSTSITLNWSRLASQPKQSGILGYSAMYEELSRPGNVGSKEIHVTFFLNTTTGRLNRLKKYSWYRIRISGMNRRGTGIPSGPLVVLTDEDGECVRNYGECVCNYDRQNHEGRDCSHNNPGRAIAI